jgi:hypothetical protein
VLSTRALQGQDWWLYRDCQLGAVLPSLPALDGTAGAFDRPERVSETVSGVDISIQRKGFKLSKSVTF